LWAATRRRQIGLQEGLQVGHLEPSNPSTTGSELSLAFLTVYGTCREFDHGSVQFYLHLVEQQGRWNVQRRFV